MSEKKSKFRIRHIDWPPDLSMECDTVDEAYALLVALRALPNEQRKTTEEIVAEVMCTVMGEP